MWYTAIKVGGHVLKIVNYRTGLLSVLFWCLNWEFKLPHAPMDASIDCLVPHYSMLIVSSLITVC